MEQIGRGDPMTQRPEPTHSQLDRAQPTSNATPRHRPDQSHSKHSSPTTHGFTDARMARAERALQRSGFVTRSRPDEGRLRLVHDYRRAEEALKQVPTEAALIGLSVGVGVIGQVWRDRLGTAAAACRHALAVVRKGVGVGTPVQLHVAFG